MSLIQKCESDLEEMFRVLQKIGDNWPPYPQGFKVPEEISYIWTHKKFLCKNSSAIMPILKVDFNLPERLHPGDEFNGVVIQKKRKKGLVYSERYYRTPQFIFPPYKLSGQIIFDKSLSGKAVIEKGELRKGEVHRFEIISICHKKHVFYCVPIKYVFNKDNLLENLSNCNYQGK
jgi:hypothetical protein